MGVAVPRLDRLEIVKPEAVMGWQRKGFQLF
jgi:hypothetical protein